jgi:cell division protein ZipA
MEELRLTFLIFGALAIAGILAHGLWTVRKKRSAEREIPKPEHLHYRDNRADADFEISDEKPDQDFDDLGIGPVRVIKTDAKKADADEANVSAMDDSPASGRYSAEPESEPPMFNQSRATQSSFKAGTVKEERLDMDPESVPEPPSFLLRTGGEQSGHAQTRKEPVIGDIPDTHEPSPASRAAKSKQPASAEKPQASHHQAEPAAAKRQLHGQETAPAPQRSEQQSTSMGGAFAEQARKLVQRKKPDITKAVPKRREPKLGGSRLAEDQMRIDFDEPGLKAEPDMVPENPPAKQSESKAVSQEVLVLNVKAPDNKPIPGSALLPSLLTLGFKFGDQDIFHRHVNSNGKGPVLFSLANMFKPGVFDIDNIETFSTQGVSLFMILPIEGDPHQVFNMMHNAARKLADEFGAQVLDGRRSALTKQSLQQYVEKIREFERQRMIKRAN